MNRHLSLSSRCKQSGAVLVVSLMLLVIMTLVGVTAMRTTILQEKMSGNTRDSTISLQAAETVLLDGEDYLENTINALAAAFNGAQLGLYALDSNPDLFDNATWVNSIAFRRANPYPGVASQPRFIIEISGEVGDGGNDPNVAGSYASSTDIGTPFAFRVTARGTGGTDNAVTIIQSNYIRTF